MTIAKFRAARQLWARVAEVARPSGRRRGHSARGDFTGDDDSARSLGEHVAHHCRRLRCRCRGRGHRPGAAVRRRDSRWFAHRQPPTSPAASPATHNCCCSRSRISAGCSIRLAGPGTSRSSPKPLPRKPGPISRISRPAAASVSAIDHIAGADRPGAGAPGRRHRPPSYRDHRVNEFPNLAEPPLPQSDPSAGRSATPPPSRNCATDPTRYLERHRHAPPGPAAAPGATGGAQHPGHASPPTCWRPAESRRSTRYRRTRSRSRR